MLSIFIFVEKSTKTTAFNSDSEFELSGTTCHVTSVHLKLSMPSHLQIYSSNRDDDKEAKVTDCSFNET